MPFDSQQPILPGLPDSCGENLYGLADLGARGTCVCGTFVVREDAGPDWAVFYIPFGALFLLYPEVGGFPFIREEDEPAMKCWMLEVSDWMAEIGKNVYHRARFEMALIGFEESGSEYRESAVPPGMLKERRKGYLWPEADTLTWYPPTRYL